MYVEFTSYDERENYTYETDLTKEEIETLWNMTKDTSDMIRRLDAIQTFAESIYKTFEPVMADAHFFT